MANKQVDNKIKEVAERIRAARESVGKTTAELAAEIGMTEKEYVSYENGNYDFSFTFIYKVANICGVEIADLMEGRSPYLTNYTVTRCGEGMPIVRREGFVYNRLAAMFKDKIAEPFYVKIPYDENALARPLHLSSHKGQEFDIVIKGTMKIWIGDRTEILHAGDSIYYDSSTPHDEAAMGGEDCEIYAIVMNPDGEYASKYEEQSALPATTNTDLAGIINPVSSNFIDVTHDENGVISDIKFKNDDKFNFAFDVVDAIAKKTPHKLAMFHVSAKKHERRFTFEDMSRGSSRVANYLSSLGVKRGDRVMLVLKRHWHFWYTILALHKLGAIAIPATNLLMEKDFDYRFSAAGVSAIICTADGMTADEADKAIAKLPEGSVLKVVAHGKRDGWHNFDEEYQHFSDKFERTEDAPCGNDPLLMFFTSGTTGYPKIALHNHKYPLGHFVTAKYWHNVDPNGLHFTISDTGWGKALWGKLYGQWLCEAPVFTYDFDKFSAADILPMLGKYRITTFCAPPTMYRFFIKENLADYDLSTIKYATTAGEALNPEVYNQFLKATGIRIMEAYGQTETTLSIGNFVGTTPKLGSMGRPSPLYNVELLLPDGTPAKVGEPGEICICTKDKIPCGLYSGYYLDEEHTKESWHDGYYHTGDTAWRDEEGLFWFVGRVDDVIKSSGYRIGPFEIESVIMELPYVLECAVTAVPDEIRGQAVKATIVLVKGTTATDDLKKEIQNYVKKRTAPYKYPRVVEFRDELPKTISGKIRRVELK